jgi:membrane protease YdiL (CAAX protease family)
VDSPGDFIQWIFSGKELPDLSGLLSGFIDHPVYAVYFAAMAAIGVALLWGTFRLAFPRMSRIAPPKWNIWMVVIAFFLFILVQAAVLAAVMLVEMEVQGKAYVPEPSLLDKELIAVISAPLVCIGGYLLLKAIVKVRAVDIGISLKGFPSDFGRGLLLVIMMLPLFLVVAALNNMYLQTVHVDTSEQAVVQALRKVKSPLEIVMMFVMGLLAAPFSEEFIFRGILFKGLRRSIGADEAILLSAAIFALLHMLDSSVAAFLPIFFLAVFLAYAYERTGSLWTPIAMHSLFNLLNLVQIFI